MSPPIGDDPVPVCAVGALLGEGPVWHDRHLWFVDIVGCRVHRFNPTAGALDSWAAPAKPGWVLPARDGLMLVGMPGSIYHFDPGSGRFGAVATLERDRPGNRLNDATVAPDGTIWFGTMDDACVASTGRLYRLGTSGVADSGLPPVPVTNGPALSPDGDLLYHVDSLGRTVWRVPVASDGTLGTASVFVRADDGAGYPDGATTDSAGNVWIGFYGGWSARCYRPDGSLLRTIRFPVENVTKLAFGGSDLKTAFATTARQELDDAALARQPHAGDVFAFAVETPGLPTPAVTVRPAHDRKPTP